MKAVFSEARRNKIVKTLLLVNNKVGNRSIYNFLFQCVRAGFAQLSDKDVNLAVSQTEYHQGCM